jgi:CubicO group peptidase (beta-lactamase class C family)
MVAISVTPNGATVYPRVSYALMLVLLGCALGDVAAQPPQTAQTRTADSLMAAYAKPNAPGCVVGAYQDGNTLYEGAFGLANLEHGVPIDPRRSVFNVGSVAKQFTAAATLLLVQDGKLRLDDDVRKYLPELPDYGRVITIDHLLSHTSGLRDYRELLWVKGTSYWAHVTEQDLLDLIVHQRTLNFAPGSKYTYSNTGYVLLSIIIRRVSGKTLPTFANERIFAPLSMTTTSFADAPGQVTPHRAQGYAFTSDTSFEARSERTVVTGDSKLYTTLADLAKWQRNFDEPTVGGTDLIRQLEEPALLNDGSRIDYARGLYVSNAGSGFRGLRTVTHSGGTWDGYRADVMRLTEQKYSTVVLCNTHEDRMFRVRNAITDIFMAGKLPEPPRAAVATPDTAMATVAPESLKDVSAGLVGMYWNREDMLVRTIELRDGKVWYVRSPESRTELAPIANGQWQMRGVGTRTVVEPASPQKGPRIVRVVGTTTSVMQKVDPFSSDLLREYAGTYTNSELGGARLVFAVKDRRLVLETPIPELDSLVPAFKDALFSNVGDALFIFQRDAAGRVTSVLVDTQRSRDTPFRRVRGPSKRSQ